MAVRNSQRFHFSSGIHISIVLKKKCDEPDGDSYISETADVMKENPETSVTEKDIKQFESLYIEKLQPFGDRSDKREKKLNAG
ncbi:MAG: hypothetical protein JW917_00670 [Ignavibacteria bacterium]|nr:hypothetical protein [Ignavibacteria bacterium]